MGAPHVSSHHCRDFSLDYVTYIRLTEEGVCSEERVKSNEPLLNAKGGRSSRRELTHIPILDKFKNTRVPTL